MEGKHPMNFTGPKVKQSRALGVALTPKAEKYMKKRPYGPGQHGQRRRRRPSDYGVQLLEKQRLRYQYNVSEKQLQRAYEQATRKNGGASGHETDKMSPSSPKETVLLAKGTNVEDGGAEMVIIELENGGKVFSVGSITWVASLFPDVHVSRITANVLSRFLE